MNPSNRRKAGFLKPKVVFEDGAILVLDKPAEMVVNRAKTTKEKTIQDWVERKFKIKNLKLKIERSGIVHRLDKETSGLLLVAKTKEAFENLQKQFKERKVKKKYSALVHGKVEPKKGVIEASISRSPFNRKKFGVFLGGRSARTKYKTINNLTINNGQFTLLELQPKTGRTHQIRVHLKHIGHPVVGDAKYAGRKTARTDRQWCPRQFLHASFLSFIHPATRKKVSLTSPLPSDLKKAIKTISS